MATTFSPARPGVALTPLEGHRYSVESRQADDTPLILGEVAYNRQSEDWRILGAPDDAPGFATQFEAAWALCERLGVSYEGRLSSPAPVAAGFDVGGAVAQMADEFRWAFPEARTAHVAGFILGRMYEPNVTLSQAMAMAAVGEDPGSYPQLVKALGVRTAVAEVESCPYKSALIAAVKVLKELAIDAKGEGDSTKACQGLANACAFLDSHQWAAIGVEL